MLKLIFINAADIHIVWNKIRAGLEKVKAHGDHWIPEDIYKELKDGRAFLHVGELDDQYVGFLITQHIPSYDGLALHVWAAYSNKPKEANILTLADPQIVEFAKAIKAKRITFMSPRKGWEKNRLGYQPGHTIFEKEVTL